MMRVKASFNNNSVLLSPAKSTHPLLRAELTTPYFKGHSPLPEKTMATGNALADVKALRQVLSPRSWVRLEKLLEHLDLKEVDALVAGNKIMQLQAAVDTLFRFYMLEASRTNAFHPKIRQSVESAASFSIDKRHPFFEDKVKLIKEQPDIQHASRRLTDNVGISNTGTPVENLLPLLYAKKLLLDGRQYKGAEWTKDRQKELLQEKVIAFDKVLPRFSPRRLQLWLANQTIQHFWHLPGKWFAGQIANILSSQTGIRVKPVDLVHYMLEKQMIRQAFDYENPNLHTIEKKQVSQKFERFIQASLLKKIYLMRNHGEEILMPKYKTLLGTSPLMKAAKTGNLSDVNETLKTSNAMPLLDTINDRDIFGNTALMYACRNLDNGLSELLLNNGADITIQNRQGKTAYSFLPRVQNDCAVDYLKLLVSKAPSVMDKTNGIWLYPHL
jgi:hypothetical protein